MYSGRNCNRGMALRTIFTPCMRFWFAPIEAWFVILIRFIANKFWAKAKGSVFARSQIINAPITNLGANEA